MGLSTGAVTMGVLVATILYGGLMYYILVALGKHPIEFLPEPLRSFASKDSNRDYAWAVIVALLIIPALTMSEDADTIDGGGGQYPEPRDPFEGSDSGSLNEGDHENYTYDPEGYIVEALFTLTWDDEGDAFPLENEGDTFRLDVTGPDGDTHTEEDTNSNGQEGRIEIPVVYTSGKAWKGEWTVSVTLVVAGDQTDPLGIIDVIEDDSNSYLLEYTMEYHNR